MACLIIAESAIFTIFVVAYLFYVGKSLTGPTPREVLETPIFFTICLLSSSLTIHFAARSLERGKRGAFLGLVAAHDCSGWALSIRHRPGMAPTDLRTRADDLHQPVWNNLLLAGRSARVSRHRWSDHAHHRAALRLWQAASGAEQSASRRSAFDVLAFCRCRVGRGFHRGLRSRTLRRRNGNAALRGTIRAKARERPARSKCRRRPRGLSFWLLDLHLLFAGLLTSVSVSVLGRRACAGGLRRLVPRSLSSRARRGCARRSGGYSPSRHCAALSNGFRSRRIKCVPGFPFETYPISAGVKGGLAGSVAMAVLACTYGVLKAGSIWYPINLLAAVVYAQSLNASAPAQLNSFHADSFRDCRGPARPRLHVWWACSMVRCFPCSRAVRLCSED